MTNININSNAKNDINHILLNQSNSQTNNQSQLASDSLMNLFDLVAKKLQPSKKLEKVEMDLDYIPKFEEHELLLRYNYNVSQLKTFTKAYITKGHKILKISGNKTQLLSRLYAFLFLSNSIIKMQKIFRGHLQRKYNRYHGPAFRSRMLCTNAFDFLSMEKLDEISDKQFFSFKDEDGFIYGFDILSLYNLIYKCNGAIKNPFNTKPISAKVIEDFRSLLRLSRLFKIQICTELTDISKEVSNKKTIELKALTLFQNIDALGNYSNSQWFLSLNRNQLIKFTRELVDIWSYRAPLTMETKRAICPPLGNPFSKMPNYNILQTLENLDDVRKHILDVMSILVNTGIDEGNKHLGAYYVLGALTLVNNEAATSLPWLYQALCYM
jgi:hypothetical protein